MPEIEYGISWPRAEVQAGRSSTSLAGASRRLSGPTSRSNIPIFVAGRGLRLSSTEGNSEHDLEYYNRARRNEGHKLYGQVGPWAHRSRDENLTCRDLWNLTLASIGDTRSGFSWAVRSGAAVASCHADSGRNAGAAVPGVTRGTRDPAPNERPVIDEAALTAARGRRHGFSGGAHAGRDQLGRVPLAGTRPMRDAGLLELRKVAQRAKAAYGPGPPSATLFQPSSRGRSGRSRSPDQGPRPATRWSVEAPNGHVDGRFSYACRGRSGAPHSLEQTAAHLVWISERDSRRAFVFGRIRV